MKKTSLAFYLLITMVLALPACAEIYKYIDENGQKRWTDDLSQVPKAQRPSAQRIESEAETSTQAAAMPAAKDRPELPPGTEAVSTDPPVETAEPSRASLEKEKAALDTRYQQLMEERKQLEQIKADEGSSVTRTELNDRISAYNRKTEQYEMQLDKFNQKIQAYNQKILSKKTQSAE
jgi:chemotaxis regulatin CheY-phosphate phosphatase CheZ